MKTDVRFCSVLHVPLVIMVALINMANLVIPVWGILRDHVIEPDRRDTPHPRKWHCPNNCDFTGDIITGQSLNSGERSLWRYACIL